MAEDMMQEKGVEDTDARIQALLEVVTSLMALDDDAGLRKLLNQEHSADVADVLRRVDDETTQRLFAYLDSAQAAEALVESDASTLRTIVDDLEHEALSGLVEEMAPDDAVDVLAELDEEHAAQVLTFMDAGEAQELQDLLVHEEDTGGGLMTPDFVLVHEGATVGDALLALQNEEEVADLFYVFVVDDENRPVGAISIHKLVRAKPNQLVNTIMTKDVITVGYDTDQEEIAHIFGRYNLMAMPVVDADGRLVGRITADDVMDVMEEESTEDIYKMAGTSHDETDNLSVLGVARSRLPWLMICLVGSIFSGAVIHLFEATLSQVIALAAFLPVITATGGNSGLQASTVTVRGLVTGQVSSGLILKTVVRECGIALVIGLTCGATASSVAWLWLGETLVGICVGLAMFLAISVAVLMGVLVPMTFDRLGVDPAIASGPFITTTNDILGFFIYLGLATLMLQYLS